MASLRSYSATFEQTGLSNAAVSRFRFNEGTGSAALDSVAGLDGSYEPGAAPGAAGSIGDGAASFDGTTGFVLVETLSGTIKVSAFGDSEIDGTYGAAGSLPEQDRFSPNLVLALEARGLDATVIDQAVSGNTSGQGLARINAVLADDPDVAIVEFGTNDALGSINLGTVESNLTSIVSQLDGAGIEVLLTGAFGFYPQRNGGTGYADADDRNDFEALFPSIADSLDVELLNDLDGSPMFLGGERIAGTPDTIEGGVLDSDNTSLSFGDGLHPNAAGVDFIVERVVPQTIALGAAAGVVNEPLLLANGAFEMWFTLDSLSQSQTLFAKDSSGFSTGGQVAAFVSTNGRLTFALTDDAAIFAAQSGANAVQAGTPTHLVANFGADGMHVFVNGVEVASNGYTGGLDAGLGNFEQLVIGAGNGASTPGTIDSLNQFFNGTIDEFAIYDRALTGGEVQQLFDGGELGTTLIGTAGADELIGGSDNEELRGAGGNDTIEGNAGNDELRGGAGTDRLRGGQGNDGLVGGRDGDELSGGAGDDALDGKDGTDLLQGGADDDLLQGGGGNDMLSGAGGNDELLGNKGVDQLDGGAGNDLLNGGNGKDLLTGGSGSDIFGIDKISHGVDKIFDFEAGAGGDVLDLSAVLDFDDGDFNDFVRLSEVGSNTKVEVNPDGAGSDFTAVFNLVGSNGLDIANLVGDGNIQLSSTPS
jgi:Ca2+-binding RTX toxin-like protein